MSIQRNFQNFGNAIIYNAILGIFSGIFSLLFSLRTFLYMITPAFSSFFAVADYITIGISVIGFILFIYLLVCTKQLTQSDPHPNLIRFYKKFLISFIVSLSGMLGYYLFSFIISRIVSSPLIVMLSLMLFLVIFSIIGTSILISGWSNFTTYATARNFNPKIPQASNLTKIAYILVLVSQIISSTISIYTTIRLFGGYPYTIVFMIIAWISLIEGIIFALSIPILRLTGQFRLGMNIRTVQISTSSEPTLGDSSLRYSEINKSSKEEKFCSNCGVAIISDAIFCPHCGNSL